MNSRFKKLMAMLLAMVMLMSMLSVTTLDGILAQAASDVIEITSPDDGSTITGKKSLTVNWAKVDGADYYLFSARNLTTDAEIVSKINTGTTRSYKISAGDLPYNSRFRFWVGAFDAEGNQIAGSDTEYEVNTYTSVEGSFDKSRYSMEVGEELDVAVDVSAKNGSLVRVTINVDASGIDRLASKSISGTSWDGSLTLDGSTYPLNTPGTYKIKLFVAYGTGSNEYDEVDQATLVVEEPCSHPTSQIEEYWEQTSGYSVTYKSISDTQHKASGYMYKYCRACLSRVGSNYPVTIDEAHSFDAAGDCTLCDYRVSCQHTNTKPVVDTSYHNEGAEGHLVVQYGNLVCTNANCGKEVEPYYTEEMKAHTFNGNTCSLCGYTKYLEMKVVVARDQASAETGNTISVKATVQGGSGVFSYAWEVLCDGIVVHQTDYSMSSEYSHTADKAGKWSFRVHVMDDNTEEEIVVTSGDITVSDAACPHTNSTPVSQDTEYIKLSDTAHEIRTFYIDFCDSCGEATSDTYYRSENAAHAPDSSGHCVCGYAAPTETCQHTESLPQQIDQRMVPYDETWHSVVTVYKDVCANADCGVVLNAHREVDDKIAHSYDDAGKCVCGYVRPTETCDHAAADTLTDTSYIDLNESNHSVIRAYHYRCECGQVDYNDTKTTTEPHVFANGTCVCGRTETVDITYGGNFSQDSYTMTVGEKLNVDITASTTNANLSRVTINVDSTANDRLAYADINGGTNWNGTLTLDGANAPLNVPGTYTIKLFVKVNNDDNAWAEVDQATLTVAEVAGCPHTTVEEYWEMTEGYSVTYKSISDTHHTASGHMYKFCTLCLSRVGDNYPVTIDEAHSFDAAGDCILCDYRVSCQHKETKPKVETFGYTSKGDEGHLFFQYGNLVCANANCGKEVEPYYAEEMQDHI